VGLLMGSGALLSAVHLGLMVGVVKHPYKAQQLGTSIDQSFLFFSFVYST
jgi:hypothetical protein